MDHITLPPEDATTTTNSSLYHQDTKPTLEPLLNQTSSPILFGDTWAGVALILALISFICCTCTLLLYHKLQVKPSVQVHPSTVESNAGEEMTSDPEDLPSYTLVSGLPNYEEAVEQMRQVNELRRPSQMKMLNHNHYATYNGSQKPTTRATVMELLQIHRRRNSVEA